MQPKQEQQAPTVEEVSILTRPGGRVQRGDDTSRTGTRPVSILTRPGGRVQRWHTPVTH